MEREETGWRGRMGTRSGSAGFCGLRQALSLQRQAAQTQMACCTAPSPHQPHAHLRLAFSERSAAQAWRSCAICAATGSRFTTGLLRMLRARLAYLHAGAGRRRGLLLYSVKQAAAHGRQLQAPRLTTLLPPRPALPASLLQLPSAFHTAAAASSPQRVEALLQVDVGRRHAGNHCRQGGGRAGADGVSTWRLGAPAGSRQAAGSGVGAKACGSGALQILLACQQVQQRALTATH